MEEVDDVMYDIIEEDHVIEESIDDFNFMDQMQTEELYEMEEEHLEDEEDKPIILNSMPTSGVVRNPNVIRGQANQMVIVQNPGSNSAYPIKLIACNTGGTTQIISQPRQPPPQTNVQIVKRTITQQQQPIYQQRTPQQPRVITQYVHHPQQSQPQKLVVKSSGQQVILASPVKQEPGTSTTITREVYPKSGITISKTRPQTVLNSRLSQSPSVSMRQFVKQPGIQIRQQPTILNRSVGRPSPSYTQKVVPKQMYKTTPGSSIQAVNVPGKGVQYVKVLNTQAPSASRSPKVVTSPRTTYTSKSGGYTVVSQTPIKKEGARPVQMIHRRVVPTQPQKMIAVVKKERDPLKQTERPGKTTVLTTSQLSQIKGVNIIPGNNSKTKIVMLPSDYLLQLKEMQRKQNEKRIVNKSTINHTMRRLKDSMDGGSKKRRCNCTKSQCLKLYCDCFAAGEFCDNCNCKDCQNDQENEEERQKAIRACLERNPSAFKPKIKEEESYRLHKKGCNCKRSGCLKNYCECYEAKVTCSGQCKCIGCHNFDPAMAEEKEQAERELQKEKEKMQAQSKRSASEMAQELGGAGSKQPCNFMTPDVIEATVQCMLAQAAECQKKEWDPVVSQDRILGEFGRCLMEIIKFSIKNDG